MPLSPRTQAMMAPEQGGDPETLFEQAFQDLALNQLVSQLPEISDRVVSMKMLELDPDNNHAVGTFIIIQGNDEIHLPVVMSDNELMPFDIMYVKSLDMMLPLTPEWLEELDRKDVEGMGDAQEPPEGLRTDEDIRNLVVPPTTGRYSYASVNVKLGSVLPEYLRRASNQVKKAFVQTLEKHPHIAKRAFEIYGVDTIKDAVRPYRKAEEKTANTELHVQFMTIETPTSEIKSVFGDKSHEAMRDIALKGYTAADQRSDVDELVATERPMYLGAPDNSGFYRIFCSNGEQKLCAVFNQVLELDPIGNELRLPSANSYSKKRQYNEQTRLGVTADGEMFMTCVEFMAEALEPQNVPPELKSYLTSPRPGTPRNGQRGFFYNPSSRNMVALEPMQIDMVVNKDGKRTMYARRYSDGREVCLVQIEGSPITSPKVFSGTRGPHGEHVSSYVPRGFTTQSERKNKFDKYTTTTILVPWHYNFVPIKSAMPEAHILRDPEAVMAIFYDALSGSGAPKVEIKSAGAGMLAIDGEQLTPFEAIKKLATAYNVSVPSAEEAVKLAEHRPRSVFYAVNDRVLDKFEARIKTAQPGMAPPPQGAPQGAPPSAGMQGPGTQQVPMGMDPMMMDPMMMQAMMGPPMPPPPSPVEIAANEVAEAISQEQGAIMQELQSQQESLQKQMETIQMVMQRAEQIAGGAGVDPATGAPMTPDMMAPPGAAPMPVEEPGMMEQAMQFEDPEMFDAAAVASLASSNDFDVSIGQFMPVMREALDGIGRLLVEFRMKGGELRATIGDEMYSTLRDRLEALFEDFGATLIQLGNLTTAEEPSPM